MSGFLLLSQLFQDSVETYCLAISYCSVTNFNQTRPPAVGTATPEPSRHGLLLAEAVVGFQPLTPEVQVIWLTPSAEHRALTSLSATASIAYTISSNIKP
jgi:hypothetical protein